MLKTVKLVFLLSTAALALSACSVLSSLIPDQKVDLMGTGDTDSSELVMPETALATEEPNLSDFDVDAPSFLKSQLTNSYIYGVFSREFDDLEKPISFSPESLKQAIGLTKVTLSGGTQSTVFPDEINLSLISFLLVWDGAIGKNINGWDEFRADISKLSESFRAAVNKNYYTYGYMYDSNTRNYTADITLKKDTNNCSTETCTYLVSNPDSAYSQFWIMNDGISRLLKFISPEGDDEARNTALYLSYYKIANELDSSLSASLTLNISKADLSFKK